MVNAWSLAASILNGTFDEDYPMKEEHSDAWYDYKRNDPNAENPFTDPEDWARACLLYTSPSPRDGLLSRMPSSA